MNEKSLFYQMFLSHQPVLKCWADSSQWTERLSVHYVDLNKRKNQLLSAKKATYFFRISLNDRSTYY